jgi:AraC-like DNA-binding protein
MVVKSELEKFGLHTIAVELGEVEITETLEKIEKEKLDVLLKSFGFELIDDKKSRIIEKVKNLVIKLVQEQNNELKINLSIYLSDNLHQDYNYISQLFTQVEGTTIEQYFILQKIEKVKELLVYDELTLSQIAFQFNYSSVAYLSNQFKKITGLTPSHFKQLKAIKRTPIEQL